MSSKGPYLREVLASGEVDPPELVEIVNRWFRRATIVVIARCSVEYSGRAASTANEAPRLVVLKKDGTLLVHGATGRDPLNWQPRSEIYARSVDDEIAEIRAVRTSPREEVCVRVRGRSWVLVADLSSAGLSLFGSEDDIVDELSRSPSLVLGGATLIAREVSTPYGRVDLLLRDASGNLVVVEVKRSRADVEAAYQLYRYVEYYRRLGLSVTGILAAPDASSQAIKYLGDHGLRFVKLKQQVKT